MGGIQKYIYICVYYYMCIYFKDPGGDSDICYSLRTLLWIWVWVMSIVPRRFQCLALGNYHWSRHTWKTLPFFEFDHVPETLLGKWDVKFLFRTHEHMWVLLPLWIISGSRVQGHPSLCPTNVLPFFFWLFSFSSTQIILFLSWGVGVKRGNITLSHVVFLKIVLI